MVFKQNIEPDLILYLEKEINKSKNLQLELNKLHYWFAIQCGVNELCDL